MNCGAVIDAIDSNAPSPPSLRVLFLVEGHTDIRFVLGLNEVCDMTLVIPARTYTASGLKNRLAESGIQLKVRELCGW